MPLSPFARLIEPQTHDLGQERIPGQAWAGMNRPPGSLRRTWTTTYCVDSYRLSLGVHAPASGGPGGDG